MNIISASLIACFIIAGTACSSVDVSKLSKIKPGTTTREEVVTILGKPSRIYELKSSATYVYDVTDDEASGKPRRQGVAGIDIVFGPDGVVSSIDIRKYSGGAKELINIP